MRIIAGNRRGALLTKLDATGTRPTADRVRESLFNILQGGRFESRLAGTTVIDLFAGTGALGLEALSRGAAHASFVENAPAALAVLRANIAKLRYQPISSVIAGDATRLAHWRGPVASLVFADAPYATGAGLTAVCGLVRLRAIAPDAVIIIETGKAEILDPDQLAQSRLDLAEQRHYGRAMLHFLRWAG